MKRASITVLVSMVVVSGLAGCSKGSAETNQAAAPASPAKPAAAQAAAADPSTNPAAQPVAAAAAPAATAAAQADAAPDKVVVYYFHGNRRCRTCIGIQNTITKTIGERFAAETAAGTLTLQEVNYEEPGNEHFVKTYDLSFGTMIVTAQKGQSVLKWENCSKVWDFAHEPAALTEYTEQNVRAYLAMLKGK